MIYKTDYHVHTDHSDGHAAAEDFIQAAVAAQIKEIGFSEHFTMFRGTLNWSMNTEEEVKAYLKHIKSLSSKAKDIIIRKGLEVDFFPGKEEELCTFLSTLNLDYIIGSVHYLGEHTVDLSPEFYHGRDIANLFETYFDHVSAAAASGLFDIIAHCDLVRIFGFKPDIDLEPLYRKLAKSFRVHDVAFEINTNGRNKPVGEFYPDKKFLKIFREEEVPVCVNSDAHMPSRIGQYFDEAYELLRNAGFTEMAVFEKRQRFMVPFC